MERALEQLVRVADAYGDALGIIDALRIQGWSEDGLTIPQMRLLWALRDEDGQPGRRARRASRRESFDDHRPRRPARAPGARASRGGAGDRRIVRNYLTDEGIDHRRAHCAASPACYIINILKRLDDAQLDRLEAALGDLNRASSESRDQQP